MSELVQQISGLRADINQKAAVDAERRKTDDARFQAIQKGQENVVKSVENLTERTDKHGLRTTTLETQWGAFFGDQGAFRLVLKGQEAQGELIKTQGDKVDKQGWYIAIGIGIIAALQFIVPILLHKG